MEELIITSVQNARVKHMVALQQKSSLRREEGLFVVEGQREIEHCIACGYEIAEAFIVDSLLFTGDYPATKVTPQVYEKIAYRGTTEGLLAVVRARKTTLDSLPQKEDALYIVLESVEKPGNLGAVLRTADAAGVDAVLVCDPLTDLYNPNLIRASLGAAFSVQLAACRSEEAYGWLKEKGIAILTAQLQDSELYYRTDMVRPVALVFGTEDKGLSDYWRQRADAHIRIPMAGMMDSLNVSVSAAILAFEAVRQRNLQNNLPR